MEIPEECCDICGKENDDLLHMCDDCAGKIKEKKDGDDLAISTSAPLCGVLAKFDYDLGEDGHGTPVVPLHSLIEVLSKYFT